MARKLGTTELQTAIYALLNSGLSYSVYDYVPEESAYPYIVISEDSGTSGEDTKDNYSRDIRQTLNIWSDYKGYKEVKQIADAIAALLDTDLSVSGFQVIDIRHDLQCLREGKLRRGILDINITLNQT